MRHRLPMLGWIAWSLLCLPPPRDAHAEAEDQIPELNGVYYERWIALASTKRASIDGKPAVRLECRYLGSFAQREAAYRLSVKLSGMDYLIPSELATQWGLDTGAPAHELKPDSLARALCPPPPWPQEPSWSPTFAGKAELARLGAGIREVSSGRARTETLELNLSSKSLAEGKSGCDDARLLAAFGGRRDARRVLCDALIDREFDRGFRRCLGVANAALNRVYSRSFNPKKMEALVWAKGEPTQAYCQSLLLLGGTRFDALLTRTHDCDSPFKTVLFSDFEKDPKVLAEVFQGIFGSASSRISSVVQRINVHCAQVALNPPAD